MRSDFHIFKFFAVALFLLSAISSGAFSFVFAPAKFAAAEMVYCPLTRKLQPVNPPKIAAPLYSLNEICASEFEKSNFALAIIKIAKLKFSNISQKDFENLAFDFWRTGKSALDALPNSPHLPEELMTKNFFSPLNAGSDYENNFCWTTTEIFTFQLNPRPPTNRNSLAYEFDSARKIIQISRRIAPRAPPASV